MCGEGVPGAYPPAKLHGCGFKNVVLQAPKSPKLLLFWYNFDQRRYIPLSNFFYKIRRGGPHPPAIFYRCQF